jgi:NTE family protein
LVLGGGAARGWAHLGVIDALREAKLTVDVVAGTSMGALVGAVFAGGKTDSLKRAALELDWKEILYRFSDISRPRSGLVDGEKVEDFIRPHLAASTIESLPLPFACVATDLLTGQPFVIDHGDVVKAVRASISIPGLFTPVYREGHVLVDGGVTNPVPVDVGRCLGAEVVIAVDINHGRIDHAVRSLPTDYTRKLRAFVRRQAEKRRDPLLGKFADKLDEKLDPAHLGRLRRWLAPDPIPNLFDVLGNSIMVMESQITDLNLTVHPADVLIRPPVSHFRIMDFDKAAEIIERGYQATRDALPRIHEALAAAESPGERP